MARDGSQTKELIDDIALRLFVEKGVTATTIKDIASTAGIAEGTIYCHYSSKQELAWELFAKNTVKLAVNLDRCQQKRRTVKDKLAAIINLYCSFFDAKPMLFSYLLLDHHGHVRKMTPDMPSPVRVLKSAIAQGMAAGEIPQADADVKTAMVLGLLIQVAVFRIYGHITQSLSSLAPTLVDNAWKILSV
jgi:AcrR family transcriptional regulator